MSGYEQPVARRDALRGKRNSLLGRLQLQPIAGSRTHALALPPQASPLSLVHSGKVEEQSFKSCSLMAQEHGLQFVLKYIKGTRENSLARSLSCWATTYDIHEVCTRSATVW